MRVTIRVFDVTLLDVTVARGDTTVADMWEADALLEVNDSEAVDGD